MSLAALAAIVLFVGALACAARALSGPGLNDRVVALHAFLLACALSAAALAVAARDAAILDVALALALTDAVIVVAAHKFLRRRSMQTPLAPLPEQRAR